jgi:hypothetical protein
VPEIAKVRKKQRAEQSASARHSLQQGQTRFAEMENVTSEYRGHVNVRRAEQARHRRDYQ